MASASLLLALTSGSRAGEQAEQRGDDPLALLLPLSAAGIGVVPADLVLDGVERLDQLQRLGGRW